MSTPAPVRHRFSVADFHRLGETGVLAPDSRVELIEGDLIDMAPIGHRHAGIVNRLTRLFAPAVGERAIVSIQNPLRLDERSEVYPDLMILQFRPDCYGDGSPGAHEVLLLIEVGDSTLREDRKLKLPLYARHGIVEVWLIDAVQQGVEVCRAPIAQEYTVRSLQRTGSLQALALPDIRVDVTALF